MKLKSIATITTIILLSSQPLTSTAETNHANNIDFRDYPQKYADNITSKMLTSGVCDNLKGIIRQMGYSSHPENIRIMQIDKITDKAYKYRCFR
ncbi:MAG: hypothetical protein JKX76_03120 [Colwellia sp.]|nr:hypothetical protein [Colwellia sp.]